jgi:hypothetical protein
MIYIASGNHCRISQSLTFFFNTILTSTFHTLCTSITFYILCRIIYFCSFGHLPRLLSPLYSASRIQSISVSFTPSPLHSLAPCSHCISYRRIIKFCTIIPLPCALLTLCFFFFLLWGQWNPA